MPVTRIDGGALVTVYDLSGTAHPMSRQNANDMIAHCRWSLTAALAAAPDVIDAAQPLTPAEIDDALAHNPQPPLPDDTHKAHFLKALTCAIACTPESCTCVTQDHLTWEDVLPVGKDRLRKAAMTMGIEVDGRANDKRLVATIDSTVDGRLSQSGDHEGAESPDAEDPETFKLKQHLIARRRLRAYDFEAKRLGYAEGLVPFGGTVLGFLEALSEPV